MCSKKLINIIDKYGVVFAFIHHLNCELSFAIQSQNQLPKHYKSLKQARLVSNPVEVTAVQNVDYVSVHSIVKSCLYWSGAVKKQHLYIPNIDIGSGQQNHLDTITKYNLPMSDI